MWKTEDQFHKALLTIIKDLTLKDKNRAILTGQFDFLVKTKVIGNFMLLWKEASKKWQPIFDASRLEKLGSFVINTCIPEKLC